MIFILYFTPVSAQSEDLTLEDSIILTMKNNPLLQQVETIKEQNLWGIKEAKSNKGLAVNYIHIDRRSTEPHTWTPSLSEISPYDYFSNQIEMSIPIYTAGKLENTIKKAEADYKIADLEIVETQQNLKFETCVEYYSILQKKILTEIAKQTVNDFKAHLNETKQMYDDGVVPWHDILQTKVKLANAENDLEKTQNEYMLAIHKLNKTMGQPFDHEFNLTESLNYQECKINQDYAIDYGLMHRPELMKQKENAIEKQAQVNIEKSEVHPQITLQGTATWDGSDFAGNENKKYTAMLVTKFELFDSGNVKAKIKQAELSKIVVQENEKQLKDDIALEISDAYYNLKNAEKRITTNKIAVEEAKANFDIAQKSYYAGVGTNLDVMDAELTSNQAETNYVSSLYEYNISRAQLKKTMGIN